MQCMAAGHVHSLTTPAAPQGTATHGEAAECVCRGSSESHQTSCKYSIDFFFLQMVQFRKKLFLNYALQKHREVQLITGIFQVHADLLSSHHAAARERLL